MFSIRSLLAPRTTVHAHCDIPCAIYTPEGAKVAADTVARMVELIGKLGDPSDMKVRNDFPRMVAVKEEHAQLCKRELLILWSDYFKPEHLAKYPDLHDKFWKAAKLCSKNKQNIDAQAAAELQQAVKEIGEIFWATKQAAQPAAPAPGAAGR